jgi:hypothetical protein
MRIRFRRPQASLTGRAAGGGLTHEYYVAALPTCAATGKQVTTRIVFPSPTTSRAHALTTEVERLLTLRETHRLNGIPAVTFVPRWPLGADGDKGQVVR